MTDKSEKTIQNFSTVIKTTIYAIRFIWKEKDGRKLLIINSIQSIINAIFPIISTIFPGFIINELTNDKRIEMLIIYLLILVGAPFLQKIVNAYFSLLSTKLELTLKCTFSANFYGQILNMDQETLDDPDIALLKDRAKLTLTNMLGYTLQISELIGAIWGIIGISAIIVTLNPLIIALILTVILLNSTITKWLNKKQFYLGIESSKAARNLGVIQSTINNPRAAKEFRLFDLKDFFLNKYITAIEQADAIYVQGKKDSIKGGILQSLLTVIQQGAIYAYLIYCVIRESLPIGTMTIYLSAVKQFSNAIKKIFKSYLNMAKNSLCVQEFITFLEIKPKPTGNKIPYFDKDSILEFKNVSFKYPGNSTYVIKNMNLFIHGNEKLCIVGANGSGKSTFIKLLLGLYRPTEGEILLNGINIIDYDKRLYLNLFSAVFQDFAMYIMSINENIVFNTNCAEEFIIDVCNKCGLEKMLNKLPKGLKTQISKYLDKTGVEPSGGEGQRIAIARACFKKANIFILDEPTAALDPISEYEIYTRFSEIITDKCAILITHRLSAVKLANKIAVFNDGTVKEYGTHDDLINQQGLYAEMYKKQSAFYQNSNLL